MARKRRRVLVVAPDGDFRHLLVSLLERAGYAVSTSSSGAVATSELAGASDLPDIVVEAVSPSREGAWTLVSALRADPASPLAEVRHVFSSDRDRPLDRLRAWEMGTDGWVVRPHHIRELTDEMQEALERSAKQLTRHREERFLAVRREVADAKQR